jgi:hypothetical protein
VYGHLQHRIQCVVSFILVVSIFSSRDLVSGEAASICVEAVALDLIWGRERSPDDGPSSMTSKIAERLAESLGSVSRETVFGCGKLAIISDS